MEIQIAILNKTNYTIIYYFNTQGRAENPYCMYVFHCVINNACARPGFNYKRNKNTVRMGTEHLEAQLLYQTSISFWKNLMIFVFLKLLFTEVKLELFLTKKYIRGGAQKKLSWPRERWEARAVWVDAVPGNGGRGAVKGGKVRFLATPLYGGEGSKQSYFLYMPFAQVSLKE